jgi:limonene-1,2-epoxide hydrolase
VFEKFKKFFSLASKVDPRIKNELYSNDTAMIERENHLCFNGKMVVLPVITLFKVENGKVTLFRDYFDANTFMKQIS